MDTRLSIAIHLLILISEADHPLSSAQMAASVGTNPSFVRNILGSLKRAGLIESQRGKAGFMLVKPSEDISVLDVYHAIYGDEGTALFDMHKNPNDKCIVGRYIHPTLNEIFGHAQQEAESVLGSTTMSDCISELRRRAAAENEMDHG